MEYKVNLTRPVRPATDSFENDDDNLLAVEVLSKGKHISQDCRVMLTFSRNGLIGFATELLRHAHEWKESGHLHIYHIVPDEDLVQRVGVYLTLGSSEVILVFSDFEKTIEELAKEGRRVDL